MVDFGGFIFFSTEQCHGGIGRRHGQVIRATR